MMSTQATEPVASLAELKRRLTYTLIKPAMRLSRLFRLPLGTVEELCRMAYFEEVRIRGKASQAETAQLMGKSLRTVGSLERRYRGGFLAPETELELTRDLEDALANEPLALEELHRRVAQIDVAEVKRLVDGLVNVKRVEVRRGQDGVRRYALNPSYVSLVRDDVDAQLDGLGHQLKVIVAAVRSRFFERRHPAVARTLNFVADPEQMEALGDDFIMELRRRCIDAEEAALKKKIRGRYAVTFVLTPLPDSGQQEQKH